MNRRRREKGSDSSDKNSEVSRVIPPRKATSQPIPDSFVSIKPIRSLGDADLDLVLTLRGKLGLDLTESFDNSHKFSELLSDDEAMEMIAAAQQVGKSEEELNSDYYSPETEALLGEDWSVGEEWNTTFNEDVDDYGRPDKIVESTQSSFGVFLKKEDFQLDYDSFDHPTQK